LSAIFRGPTGRKPSKIRKTTKPAPFEAGFSLTLDRSETDFCLGISYRGAAKNVAGVNNNRASSGGAMSNILTSFLKWNTRRTR
jgi:hypothetical protein